MSELHARMLERAVEILGGTREVADYLGVSPAYVRFWMRGMFSMPDDAFLRLVDLLSDRAPGGPDAWSGKRPG